jgi:concentrative nucleoside transporter, CNT family
VLRLVSVIGLCVFILIAWALSEDRKRVSWRLVLWGVALQFAIGLLILKTPLKDSIFAGMAAAVTLLTDSAKEGSRFVFGMLTDGNITEDVNIGAVIAFQVLPVIIFVSAIAAILHHLRIIQAFVYASAWLMRRTLKTSGAETFGAALLVFLGIEAVAGIRAYLEKMTRSELCVIMTTFMATIAGSVMVIYANFGAEPGHLLAASLMSAPAAIVMAKLLVPETGTPQTAGHAPVRIEVESHNLVDAATRGTAQGLNIALHVGAMLIVFIGLVYLLDRGLVAAFGLGFSELLGYVFRPFALLMGVSGEDATVLAQLLGKKTALNEFLAYIDMQTAIQAGQLTPRGITIATYALCGFANPGSIGIMIAGLDALVPERRVEITQLSVRAFIGGTLACFTTACCAGVLI